MYTECCWHFHYIRGGPDIGETFGVIFKLAVSVGYWQVWRVREKALVVTTHHDISGEEKMQQ